jgi:hypothetical protein
MKGFFNCSFQEGAVDGDNYYEEDRLKYQDLLSFARQIAKGMVRA